MRQYRGFDVKIKGKDGKKLKESCISPTKTEQHDAIEQIIAMEESAEHDLEDGEKRDKMEGDKLKAEEMHRTAMDTLGKTQKIKSKEGQSKAKKSRSGGEMVEFLKLKAEQDMDIKKQEFDLRKQDRSTRRWLKPKDVQPNVETTTATSQANV